MVSRHSADDQGVHYRLPRPLVADLKAEVARRGWTEKEIVAAAIRREIDDPSACPECHDTNRHHCPRCVRIETELAARQRVGLSNTLSESETHMSTDDECAEGGRHLSATRQNDDGSTYELCTECGELLSDDEEG